MPELPEVETIRRELEPVITGRKIIALELFWPKTLKDIEATDFEKLFGGHAITGLDRRGKYLLFEMGSGLCFSMHFRMTGSVAIGQSDEATPDYCRAVIRLDGDLNLYFTDPRKFGCIEVLEGGRKALSGLGPEPLEDAFTLEVFEKILADRKSPVKAVLLNQRNIAGIGNMYADEALFNARINPQRPAGSLNQKETRKLFVAIRSVLTWAIEQKGATVSDYARPGGETGSAQDDFCVAHRRGYNCRICNAPIERIVVCQRGTYFCPLCQH